MDALEVSTLEGETRKWRDCDNCACVDTFEYEGQPHWRCSQTQDYEKKSWCFVQGGSSCPGETRKWRDCDNCACMDTFEFEGLHGQGQPPPW